MDYKLHNLATKRSVNPYTDNYTGFIWNGHHSSDFNCFIENTGHLTFEPAPDFSNSTVSPAFYDGALYTGTQTQSKKIQLNLIFYQVTLEDFNRALAWLDRKIVSSFLLDYNPDWRYQCKLASLGVTEKYIDGYCIDESHGSFKKRDLYICRMQVSFETVDIHDAISTYANVITPQFNIQNINSYYRASVDDDFQISAQLDFNETLVDYKFHKYIKTQRLSSTPINFSIEYNDGYIQELVVDITEMRDWEYLEHVSTPLNFGTNQSIVITYNRYSINLNYDLTRTELHILPTSTTSRTNSGTESLSIKRRFYDYPVYDYVDVLKFDNQIYEVWHEARDMTESYLITPILSTFTLSNPYAYPVSFRIYLSNFTNNAIIVNQIQDDQTIPICSISLNLDDNQPISLHYDSRTGAVTMLNQLINTLHNGNGDLLCNYCSTLSNITIPANDTLQLSIPDFNGLVMIDYDYQTAVI